MARIRTIKPEFFTSEDIVALSPLARLLYIATWCEADKEGRLLWKPGTFKLRYFPGDNCDIEALCAELTQAGLVVLYGKGLAYIPMFGKHQHVNPRESKSALPAPDSTVTPEIDASPRVSTRAHQELTDREEGKGREGKGKEGEPTLDASLRSPRGDRLPKEWKLPKAWGEWALVERPDWTADYCRSVAASFADHWHAKTGKDATKLDWEATWRNWVRAERRPPIPPPGGQPDVGQLAAGVRRHLGMTDQPGEIVDG